MVGLASLVRLYVRLYGFSVGANVADRKWFVSSSVSKWRLNSNDGDKGVSVNSDVSVTPKRGHADVRVTRLARGRKHVMCSRCTAGMGAVLSEMGQRH